MNSCEFVVVLHFQKNFAKMKSVLLKTSLFLFIFSVAFFARGSNAQRVTFGECPKFKAQQNFNVDRVSNGR